MLSQNNVYRITALLTALTLCVLSFSGCTEIAESAMAEIAEEQTEYEPQPYPVSTDGLVFSASPEKVASLSPAVTEIICSLGFEDRLVCRSEYCDYPPEITQLPTAGSAANPDISAIISYEPQLLISMSPIANKDIASLQSAGINVMILSSPKSNEELYSLYERLSLIFNGSIDYLTAADNALAEYRSALDEASGSCGSIILILGVFGDVLSVAAGDTFAGDYVSCFGENAAAASDSMTITAAELAAADPDVILLASPLGSEDIGYELASGLTAFDAGRVYVIDASLTERPTARLAELTKRISETLKSGSLALE